MFTVLSVAEKPSVAKSLAEIIGRGQNLNSRPGLSPYNRVYEVTTQLNGQPCRMIITSVLGHMMELKVDDSFSGSWASTNPLGLFSCNVYKVFNKAAENLKKTLQAEVRRCDGLMLWLDCDLEGENIAFEVMSCCSEVKRGLQVFRAKFSALNDRDIQRALRHPEQPNAHMNDAVDARQEIDLRLGAVFTRWQTLRLQAKFSDVLSGQSFISYGPCQFPTLGFVVDRYLLIKGFVSEDYWYITLEVEAKDEEEAGGRKKTLSFAWERHRLYDHLACLTLYEMCLAASEATVVHCDNKPTCKPRPCPLNTIELQKEASRHLRLSSDRTMLVAEKLYQNGIISYPRTETTVYKEGFELLALVQEQSAHGDWGSYATNLLEQNGFEWPRDGGQDDQAHPPIHPLKQVSLADLADADEKRVYDMIVRHFLACCSKDARGHQSSVTLAVPTLLGAERFKATGLMVVERAWLDVYKWTKWPGSKIPPLKEGDAVPLSRMEMAAGHTEPPQPLSEVELIAAMDSTKIGTDATIAAHIKTIQDRQYVEKDAGGRFLPTRLGLALHEGYENMGYKLMKPFLRAQMEQDVAKIARGEMSKAEAVKSCLDAMKEVYMSCVRDVSKLDDAMTKHFHDGADNAMLNIEANFEVILPDLSQCALGHPMDLVLRTHGDDNDNRQLFVHCVECAVRYSVPSKGDLSPTEHVCAICSVRVVNVLNVDTNKSHTICPKCFRDPPGPPYAEEGVADFRCFSCAHPTCTLAGRIAGGGISIATCHLCKTGEMTLNKRAGKFVFSCTSSACKYSWWLPKHISAVTPEPDSLCQPCSTRSKSNVAKICISNSLSSAPPGCPPEALVCPACDPFWDFIDCDPLKLLVVATNDRSGSGFFRNNRASGATAVPPANRESVYSAAAAGSGAPRRAGAVSTRQPTVRVEVGYADRRGREGATVTPMCGCALPSVMRVVAKEGPNKGKQFFVCSKQQQDETRCNFFKFSDSVGDQNDTNGRDMICSHCKQSGHFARACPNK